METAIWIVRIIAVIALMFAAVAVSTPPGRIPLPLRGLAKILGKYKNEEKPVSAKRKVLAFFLVVLSAAVAAF
jgi:hypothetical protein